LYVKRDNENFKEGSYIIKTADGRIWNKFGYAARVSLLKVSLLKFYVS